MWLISVVRSGESQGCPPGRSEISWNPNRIPTSKPDENSVWRKALSYLHEQWPKLIRYLDDGRLEIDNNLTENAIRPFVVGRKNWLFSDTIQGVNASSNLYSLIETAKANGLEPYAYLRKVFTQMPVAQSVEHIEALLPFDVSTDHAPTN
jgi:transposase